MAESLQNLKLRQKGVHNINQITKAMELVAATKMRRSQEIALASRPYAFAALDLLSNLSRITHEELPPLLQKREVVPDAHGVGAGRTTYVVVTSDKGLAGSFNNALLRDFEKYATRERIDFRDPHNTFVAIGQKAAQFLEKKTGLQCEKFTPLEKSRPAAADVPRETQGRSLMGFVRVGDYVSVAQVAPIAHLLTSGFLEEKWDRVIVFSTNFRSALRQDVLVREILPVTFEKLKKTAEELIPETGRFAELVKTHRIPLFTSPKPGEGGFTESSKKIPEYLIEPAPREVLDELAAHLVLMEIYHLVLEANASEHAARRMAMKSASDNASELSAALSLEYNKSRQALITREIIEITAGADSLK